MYILLFIFLFNSDVIRLDKLLIKMRLKFSYANVFKIFQFMFQRFKRKHLQSICILNQCGFLEIKIRLLQKQNKALFTRDILAHNIAKKIKRYYNKKIFLSHRFQYLTKVSSEKNVTYLELRAYLGLQISMAQKYIFIAISFYHNIVRQNVTCE